MQISQKQWTKDSGWKDVVQNNIDDSAQLVLAFGGREIIKEKKIFEDIRSFYPKAHIILGSTAGEILGMEVFDNSLVVNAFEFVSTKIEVVKSKIKDANDSQAVGEYLAKSLPADNLKHVLVISEGLKVNGSALAAGIVGVLPQEVSVTGGLVGDEVVFEKTLVGLDGPAEENLVVAVGFYGEAIEVGYASVGGWDSFGIDRLITKSKNNILYELDGKPALALYKEYLGDKAKDLPSSGLLFPLSVKIKRPDGVELELVRTLLSVDEKTQSMTFAGDVPEGTYARLMKTNFDHLVDGAEQAAKITQKTVKEPEFALLISCVGRKIVLKERIAEELEAVQNVLGQETVLSGFYSYGELCPLWPNVPQCQLHNQTMTITTFKEK